MHELLLLWSPYAIVSTVKKISDFSSSHLPVSSPPAVPLNRMGIFWGVVASSSPYLGTKMTKLDNVQEIVYETNHLFLVTSLLQKFTSEVDGFTFVHFYLKGTTSDEKVGYKQEKSSSEDITFWERLRDTETYGKSAFCEHWVPSAYQQCVHLTEMR